MLSVTVRFADATDMAAVCEIVNHFILTATVNFRTQPQAPAEWVSDWTQYHERCPWLVATSDRRIIGIAYSTPWKVRAAYDWCIEVTVYVAHDAVRQGIGRALYQRLLDLIDHQGYRSQIAVIGLPNDPSVALHEAFGFSHSGTLREAGYKFGGWHDVGFWQRRVRSTDVFPSPIGEVPGLKA